MTRKILKVKARRSKMRKKKTLREKQSKFLIRITDNGNVGIGSITQSSSFLKSRKVLQVKARKECPDLVRGKCLENLKRSSKCERGIYSECCFIGCGWDCFQLCPQITYLTNLVKKDEEEESKKTKQKKGGVK
ncbi:MAG: hypothetical protein DDT23_00560 [candidate division WS2 bacterium]|nr:hypothetical protein [Candidatus Lithacetigena glycinireducens]